MLMEREEAENYITWLPLLTFLGIPKVVIKWLTLLLRLR
jgi:hypothetical protein